MSLLRADWNNPLAHSPCHGSQIAADLLQSSEQKFDQLGGAVSLYSRGAKGQPTCTDTQPRRPVSGDVCRRSAPAYRN